MSLLQTERTDRVDSVSLLLSMSTECRPSHHSHSRSDTLFAVQVTSSEVFLAFVDTPRSSTQQVLRIWLLHPRFRQEAVSLPTQTYLLAVFGFLKSCLSIFLTSS